MLKTGIFYSSSIILGATGGIQAVSVLAPYDLTAARLGLVAGALIAGALARKFHVELRGLGAW